MKSKYKNPIKSFVINFYKTFKLPKPLSPLSFSIKIIIYDNEIIRPNKSDNPRRQRRTELRYGDKRIQAKAIEWVDRVSVIDIQPSSITPTIKRSL